MAIIQAQPLEREPRPFYSSRPSHSTGTLCKAVLLAILLHFPFPYVFEVPRPVTYYRLRTSTALPVFPSQRRDRVTPPRRTPCSVHPGAFFPFSPLIPVALKNRPFQPSFEGFFEGGFSSNVLLVVFAGISFFDLDLFF